MGLNSDLLTFDLKEHMTLEVMRDRKVVCYKGIPLWKADLVNSIEELEFSIYDPTETEYPEDDPDYYCLVCVDRFKDSFTFGRFRTEGRLSEWLRNPSRDIY